MSNINTIIKKRNEELISATSQLQMITEHLETLEKPQKNSFPFKDTPYITNNFWV